METSVPSGVSSLRISRTLIYSASALAIILFLIVALGRLLYPLELETLEGGTFVWLSQAYHTGVVYPPANLDYIPYNYTPLHIYVSLFFSFIFGGPSFIVLRLISIIATLGTAWLVGKSLQEKSGPGAILLGAGLYLATYFPLYTWYDLGRVDSLAVFWAMLGLYLVWKKDNGIWLFVAGLIVGLAFATKQVFIVTAIPALLFLFGKGKKPTIMFILGLLVGDPLLFILFDRLNNGNAWLYCFDIPSHFPVGHHPIKIMVLIKHLVMMAPLFLLALWQTWLEVRIWKRGWLRRIFQSFWALTFILMLAAGTVLNLQPGAAANTLMIFVPFLTILAGRWILSSSLGRFPITKGLIVCLGIIFCTASDGWIGNRLPSPQQRSYYERLTGFLQGEERPFISEFSYEVLAAGKPPVPDTLMISALAGARPAMMEEFHKRRDERFYSMVILGRGGGKAFWTQNGAYKEVGDDILKDMSVANDFGNYAVQPVSICIPSDRDADAVLVRLKECGLIER